ncbi:MAG: ethanolamine phosphate transferase 3 subunit [Verrucomicrobiota bacterium]
MRTGRTIALGLVPLVLLLGAMLTLAPEHSDTAASQARAFDPSHHFRSIVFILDSAGKSDMFDPELMPFLASLRTSSVSGRSRSCAAKATFPCIKSIFEGREATMGTTLQDFSAFASSRTTWPSSLAALGTRLVVASDHTLNRLYPHAFVDSINYEDLHVPLLERDAFVYGKARKWLDDPSIDVLVLHIIGTDKVSHEYPVRGPEYRAKYREVDDFLREVAGRLQETDYIFAISDHGHNELGGHTEDAAYLARGPIFPRDIREDLNAEDMLFLLSVPYGLSLPAEYEGQIRMDLTRLAPETAERWLAAQANAWRIPIAAVPMDQAQARLNEEIVRRRTEGHRQIAIQIAWRTAPFLLIAALFLVAELHGWRPEPRRAIFLELTLLAVTLALGFWLFPAGLTWIHYVTHRPPGYVAFYAGSALIAYVGFRYRNVADILWVAGVAVWLLAYFGPLGYSLFRHGSLFVLTIFPIAAVIAAAGWRTLLTRPALFLAGLLPLVIYDVESFNLKYFLLDRIPHLLLSGQLLLAAMAAGLFVVALPRRKVAALFGVLLWLILARFFFQFDLAKLVGALLACCGFAGCLELFRRARLPLRWFALVSAVFFFVLLTFFLNGFALSHVDFRFAATRIFPFAKELWRAPQLIAWAMLKYAFALGPAFAVLRLSEDRNEIWREILLLGWWRELMVAASALGLAIFDERGMRDLCEEEIYFWTFLNLIFFAAALTMAWRADRRVAPALASCQ